MADFVSIEKAADLEGVTGRAIELNVSSGKYATRLSAGISANGKRKTLIDVHSLSIPAQIKYYDVEEQANATPGEQLTGISAAARKAALGRLVIVQEAEEIRERHRHLACSAGGADGAGAVAALKALAVSHQISYQTLCRWRKDFKQRGFVGLLPKHGKDRGSRLDPKIIEAIQTEWLQPTKPSQWTVFEKVSDWCAAQLLTAPSYKTVQRVIEKIPQATAVYWRSGAKKWLSDSAPKGVRDLSDIAVNEWWCSDHREFDCFVQAGNKVVRPWLTSWMDLRSRKIVGRTISLNPNSRTVALSFRQGVLSHGRPKNIYKDNGKDYSCHYLNGKTKQTGQIGFDSDSQGVFALLNVAVHNAIPYSAWSKPIERWHGNIPTWEREIPGWCGKDNKERPEKLSQEIRDGKLLTLGQFTSLFDEWLAKYNARPHSELGCAPVDLWQNVTREIPEERSLDLLLMEEVRRKVNPSGIKVFPGRWHYGPELAMYIGESVTVRYDVNEVGRIYVYLEGGRKFLCTAVERHLLRMGASQEDMRANAREKADARRQAREYREKRMQIPNDDTRLAAIIQEKKQIRVEAEISETPKPAAGGTVIKLVTRYDRQAKDLQAAPEPDLDQPSPAEQAEAISQESYSAQLEREFAAKKERDRQRAEQEERDQQRIYERR